MAFLEKKDLKTLYEDSTKEAHIWRTNYPQFERLADNDLMEGLDPNLPEVNDGSLAASLFKLPKRIVSSKLTGTVTAVDRDEKWVSELANLVWQKEIIPNANTQAPFIRKWKDAVRKAAIYGSVPLITIFVEKDGKRHADFIVGQPQDVTLEPGKVSDYDSEVEFWDVYFTRLQLKNMIEQAKAEKAEAKDNDSDEYNKWDIPAMQEIYNSKLANDERSSLDTPRQQQDKDVRPKGYKFCIAVQRGVNAPFYMYYSKTDKTIREWSNPDPTGDTPIHFLYCYQDFINPYGIGIVKLAGGTQNVLDYMRQADVLATQLGLRPPISIEGDADSADLESFVYAQDALWFTGQAKVERQELANGVYSQLPERMSMYKTSLNQLIPTGDTSIAAGSGDPNYSKTPAGVKFQAASLSIDDEDFKDNFYATYEAVAKSLLNTHFANMEGKDLMKLGDDERELLIKAGINFEPDAEGNMSNEVEMVWDTLRAKFNFEVDPEVDKAQDDQTKLDGLTKVAELIAADPTLEQDLMTAGKKLNRGELYADMIGLTTDNDKIITDISPDEQGGMGPDGQPVNQMGQQGQPTGPTIDPNEQARADESHQMDMTGKAIDMALKVDKHQQGAMPASTEGAMPQPEGPMPAQTPPTEEEIQANIEAVMKEYGVSEHIATAALAAEHQGTPVEQVIEALKAHRGV